MDYDASMAVLSAVLSFRDILDGVVYRVFYMACPYPFKPYSIALFCSYFFMHFGRIFVSLGCRVRVAGFVQC